MEQAKAFDDSKPDLYCEARDHRHLYVCMYGKVNNIHANIENVTNVDINRASVLMSPCAPSCILLR